MSMEKTLLLPVRSGPLRDTLTCQASTDTED